MTSPDRPSGFLPPEEASRYLPPHLREVAMLGESLIYKDGEEATDNPLRDLLSGKAEFEIIPRAMSNDEVSLFGTMAFQMEEMNSRPLIRTLNRLRQNPRFSRRQRGHVVHALMDFETGQLSGMFESFGFYIHPWPVRKALGFVDIVTTKIDKLANPKRL